ncbi:bifunctional riboflavin kinase/FAD synthetase [Paenibacillus radicibacter]|uniref:bifunctional riboflavin kinase/FAD synthetase n=1 Tax=Paenibacillus radicibacter TaxID=2972488 RepID=UPI0021594393|nr:bifunctional riboflavin kinase/FAD synthetase [Paenibacillus radicibacter]
MKIISLTYPLTSALSDLPEKQVLAIGEFDGVHLGHQEVISRAMNSAKAGRVPLSVMSFNPHPREVLGQEQYKYTQLLTPISVKMDLLSKVGVEYAYLVTFNETLMRMSPAQFVEEILIRLGVETVIVGFDFRFGYQAEGNVDLLCELSKGRFAVEVVRPYQLQNAKVSSSAVRDKLLNGEMTAIELLLGRRYSISGEVVHGDARGRQLGFPTANIKLTEPYVVPRNGVYAARVTVNGEQHDSVMNIGIRPTFEGAGLVQTLEAHILDFDQDIYGKQVIVEFIDFIRSEQKFSSIQDLIAQIKLDVESCRAKLFQV